MSDPSAGSQVRPLGRCSRPWTPPPEGGDGSNAVGNLASNDALIEPSAISKIVEDHEALENDENPSQQQ